MTMLNTQSSWNVGRPASQCAACGTALLPDQPCWAALCERPLQAAGSDANEPIPQAESPRNPPPAKSQDSAAAVSPFVRLDFCEKCWAEGRRPPTDSNTSAAALDGGGVMFSHWKTIIPVPEQKKRLLVEDSVLVDLFQRMDGRTDPREIRFRFVLALILMRKRLLKYEGMEDSPPPAPAPAAPPPTSTDSPPPGPAPEVWLMRLRGTEEFIKVLNPHLNQEQIGEVSGHLSSILAEEV